MEMKVSHGPRMRRQLATLYSTFHTIYSSSSFSPISHRFPSINSSPLSYHSFSHGRSLSFSAAATLPSPLSPTPSGDEEISGIPVKGSKKVLLKGMRYHELEKWVQSHGYRTGQALMLWKRLYGNDVWAHCNEELEGYFPLLWSFLGVRFVLLFMDALKTSRANTKGTNMKECVAPVSNNTKASILEMCIIPCRWGNRVRWCKSSGSAVIMVPSGHLFCRMGLKRNLSAAEIVEQAVFARRLLSNEVGTITNVVFMGMGEPLHNFENVIKAADIMVDDQGLHFSPRKVTISTSGLVPQIKRFLKESNYALAVSLNATTDEVRNWVMPINRKYNLDVLLGTLREELCLKRNYKVLFEYVMLAGVNDSIEDAKRLINLVQGIPCKINLISFNPHRGSQFKPTREEKMIEFRNILAEAGIVVFLRFSRGDDQMAACGQLGKPGEIQAPLLKVPAKFRVALEASV
ncbi:hypothetical protein DH2020_027039 [Rehmannia glutinosa]|uniref:Radical SAM core domain-containing protein n=1 Tax=Rehmannia glutinosa TaxID=99300 RepID=A0ABR0VYY8_REHGL